MADSWRLFTGTPGPAADEMALDAALLAAAKIPALRLWGVSAPAELVGNFAHSGGDGAVRRPTGGPKVKMEPGGAGWSVVLPAGEDPVATVEKVAVAAAAAVPGAGVREPDVIEKDGKKIGWFGGAGLGANVLVQGGVHAPPEDFAEALQKSLAGVFSVGFADGELAPDEEERVIDPPAGRSAPPHGPSGDLPTAGGTLRATIVPEEGLKKIKSAHFSGTFSAYPVDVVDGLERCVAGSSIDEAPALIEDFFTKQKGRVAGVEPGEFLTAMSLAFMKVRLTASAAPEPDAWKKELS